MVKMSLKKKRKSKVLPIVLVMVVVGLAALTGFLFLKYKDTKKLQDDVAANVEEDGLTWAMYKNDKFGYSVDYPKFLYREELEGRGDYLGFTIFSENEFTQAKGMGIGVRKDSLENEVGRLEKNLEEEFGTEPSGEEEIKIDGRKAILIKYEPVASEEEDLMAKNIIVVEKDGYVYSISTVPEQTERVIKSFKFIG